MEASEVFSDTNDNSDCSLTYILLSVWEPFEQFPNHISIDSLSFRACCIASYILRKRKKRVLLNGREEKAAKGAEWRASFQGEKD